MNRIKKVLKSEFNKNVLKIFSGTLVAQVLTIGIMPIVTRIYTPEDFSNLALYTSVTSILSMFVTLKYDKAIMLPKKEKDAFSLIVLSIGLTIFFGLIFYICYFFFFDYLTLLFKVEGVEDWLIFVPISVIVIGLYNILNTWFNRKKEYNRLSFNRILTSIGGGASKIFFQLILKFGAFGLVLGEFFSQVLALFFFGKNFVSVNRNEILTVKINDIKKVSKEYKSFPIYSLPADFVNSVSRELPVLLLSGFYEASTVGFYMLTKNTLNVPFNLLSTSILEVFKQKTVEDYNSIGNCYAIFKSTLKKLIVLSVVPFILLYFTAPFLFTLVFGDQWRESGVFAQMLTVMYFFKFISSPLSYVFYVAKKIRIDLILQSTVLLLSWLSLMLGNWLNLEVSKTLLIYAIVNAIMYLVYLYFSYLYSRNKNFNSK